MHIAHGNLWSQPFGINMRNILTAIIWALCLITPTVAFAAPVTMPEDMRSTDVKIAAGTVTLAATLYRPARAKGNLPAIVIVHGSGPTTREMTTFWTNSTLWAGGVAVLVYDKRGTGKSTGHYPEWDVKTTPAMFSDLASDVEYAVRWLATQPGVDGRRVGLAGGSQAGWIMPLAASREPLIRSLFIGEGVPLAAGIEEVHSTYLDSVATYDKSRPTLRQINAADVLAEDYIGELGYDPATALSTLSIPVMWTYGLYDEAIPTHLSIDRIGTFQKSGKSNFDIHIFPFGDHNFYNVFSGKRYDLSVVLRGWLEKIHVYSEGQS